MDQSSARKAYFAAALALVDELEEENEVALDDAAIEIGSRLCARGRLILFGCGHSGLAAQDLYYRAGGLMDAEFLFDERVTLDHQPVEETSVFEKEAGWAAERIKALELGEGDSVIVVSTSGVNAAPVDAALTARESGAYVVALTSRRCSEALEPRHPSGKRLAEVADAVLDNLSPFGDTLVMIGPEPDRRGGSASTVASALLLQALAVGIAGAASAQGIDLPLYVSGNRPGGMEENAARKEGRS